LVKSSPAIVLARVADFWTQVTALDSFNVLPCGKITNLYYEGLDSIVVLIYQETSEHNCVRSIATQVSWPEFSGSLSGTVNNELVCSLVERSEGFKLADIRPMPKFSLGIAA
jgi:hypothetical protein